MSKTDQTPLQVELLTFGYKRGMPDNANLVFDVRFLNNPFYMPELEPMCGLDAPVVQFIENLPETDAVFLPWQALVLSWLTAHCHKGTRELQIAIGCTGGKHRSVYWAERTAQWLKCLETMENLPLLIRVTHRDCGYWTT